MEKKRNLWVIPTDKPSRLWEDEFGISRYGNESFFYTGCTWKNIYITSDEEIKEGYYLDLTHNIIMKSVFYPSSDKNCKKIILTTDQSLDGIQAIDDEFLEWFVKNPSCEEIKVADYGNILFDDKVFYMYKIIIPKEEPKQDLRKYPLTPDECFKQETLEEAAERLQKDKYGIFISKDADVKGQLVIDTGKAAFSSGMNEGAKWMQERMYSEEDMKNAFDSAREFNSLDGIVDVHIVLPMGGDMSDLQPLHFTFEEWFEQFKKK